jgi:hypothetical protein
MRLKLTLLLILLAGCGETEKTKKPVEAGRYYDNAQKFSIQIPTDWKLLKEHEKEPKFAAVWQARERGKKITVWKISVWLLKNLISPYR